MTVKNASQYNFFALKGGIEARALKDIAKQVIGQLKTATDALKSTDDAIKLYGDILDNILPWKAFNETLAELDKYKDEYSEKSGEIIGDIKSLMKDGVNAYYHASGYIFGWCDNATPLLQRFVNLFNSASPHKAVEQKEILITVLTKGVDEMKSAQDSISDSSLSFNQATGKLTTLNSRFQVEFTEKSEFYETKVRNIRLGAYLGTAILGPIGLGIAAAIVEGKYVPELKDKMSEVEEFYKHLKVKVKDAFRDIDVTKNMLNLEIMEIGELKVETKETRAFLDLGDIPELRDTLMKSAESLIDNCDNYRKKHAQKAY